MTDLHTAAKQALNEMRRLARLANVDHTENQGIVALEQVIALAEQPAQQTPVAHIHTDALELMKRPMLLLHGVTLHGYAAEGTTAVYTRPQAREPEQPAQAGGETIVQTFTGLPRRKLRELLAGGWEVNGVCFQRTEEDGTVRRGAATIGGMVIWWNAEQPAQKRPPNCGTGFCSCIECVMEPKQPAPTKCWKCGDADPAFTDVCQVPACGMREQP